MSTTLVLPRAKRQPRDEKGRFALWPKRRLIDLAEHIVDKEWTVVELEDDQ